MGEIRLDDMSNEYFDVLRELGNIGAGNATTALAQMMQCKVDMAVPKVQLLEFKELGEAMVGEETVMAGIYLGIEGDIKGSIMFLLEKAAAKHLVGKLMGAFLFETAFGADDEDAEGLGYLRGDFLEDALRGAYPSNLPCTFDGVLVHTKPSRNVDFGYYFSIVAQMSDFVKMLKALRVVCAGLWLLWRRMDFLLCGDFEPRLMAEI